MEFRLTMNYRSTKTIVEASNKLIQNNGGQNHRILFTNSEKNQLIEKYEKLQNDSANKKLILNDNYNDYHYEQLYNIKNNANELPQYSALYLKRLEITKKKLLEDCKIKWPKIHICKNILDLKGIVIKFFIIFPAFRKNKL